jgi:hypothetical protein
MTDFQKTEPLVSGGTTDMIAAVAVQAKDVASEVAHQAHELVAQHITNHQSQSASDIEAVARALRDTGRRLEGNTMSPYVNKAADHIERLSRLVRTTSADELKGAAETFARREPALFLGGAFVLGILGARFLKSSSRAPVQSSDRGGGARP